MVAVFNRFLSKVVEVESGCHEWQSTLNHLGYGKFWFEGKQMPAHRMSWMLQVGAIPEGMCVLHKCDNRKCVNPEHLYAGTLKDNARDRSERCPWFGRMKTPFTVIEKARRLYATGSMSQQAIGALLGIRQTQVSRYVRNAQRVAR